MLGGARSGKSRFALDLAERSGATPIFIATAEAGDEEMRQRIERHKRERSAAWRTVEVSTDLSGAIESHARADTILLIDCVTLWLSNLMAVDADVDAALAALTASIAKAPGGLVFVSNEIGLGLVPDTALGRAFRDHQGRANQQIAAACDLVIFVAAGLSVAVEAEGRDGLSVAHGETLIRGRLMRLPVALRGLRRFVAPPREEAFDLAVDRAFVRIAVKRVSTSRRFTLRVRAASQDVVLTMPKRASAKEARAFAERHAHWLAVRLARLPKPVPFAPDAVIPVRGVEHRLVHDAGARSVPHLMAMESEPVLRAGGDAAFFARRVADFLKREARRDLERAVAFYCAKLSLPRAPLTLRDTTSRWGSCTSKGRLNFSWRLILAPDYVLDYLAAHEVAHLRHMNHSPAYWRMLKDMCPATDRAEAWLKTQGSQLHRFGAG